MGTSTALDSLACHFWLPNQQDMAVAIIILGYPHESHFLLVKCMEAAQRPSHPEGTIRVECITMLATHAPAFAQVTDLCVVFKANPTWGMRSKDCKTTLLVVKRVAAYGSLLQICIA